MKHVQCHSLPVGYETRSVETANVNAAHSLLAMSGDKK